MEVLFYWWAEIVWRTAIPLRGFERTKTLIWALDYDGTIIPIDILIMYIRIDACAHPGCLPYLSFCLGIASYILLYVIPTQSMMCWLLVPCYNSRRKSSEYTKTELFDKSMTSCGLKFSHYRDSAQLCEFHSEQKKLIENADQEWE